MSHDVILGSTDRSWSRDFAKEPTDQSTPLTEQEKTRIEKLAKLEMLATRGDAAAQKKLTEVNAALATLQIKAQKGDAKSKRILTTLRESGLVTASESNRGPKLVMAGSIDQPCRPLEQRAKNKTSSGYNSHWAYIQGFGSQTLGEEEVALAREGGACERAALRRRF